MTIYQKLAEIQQEIKCPKDKPNTFGNYKYRSAEGILEVLKPIMAKHKVMLVLNDDIRMIGDRIYVMAEAKMIDLEGETTVSTCAFAREALDRPKMDEAQITGAASSYARKYALNGLLLLDDNKDPDTDEYTLQQQDEAPKQPEKKERRKPNKNNDIEFDKFVFRLMEANVNTKDICNYYKVKRLEDLTQEQIDEILKFINGNNRNN